MSLQCQYLGQLGSSMQNSSLCSILASASVMEVILDCMGQKREEHNYLHVRLINGQNHLHRVQLARKWQKQLSYINLFPDSPWLH